MAESWKARLRRGANGLLHPLGLHLVRRRRAFEMDDLLAQAVRNAIAVHTWIDVGASDGSWSLQARLHYSGAQFLLFEPLAERQAALQRLQRRHRFQVVAAAAGAAPGTVDFQVAAGLDGSGIAAAGATGLVRPVAVETVDRAIGAAGLAGPYGMKLDTHGAELSVLAGAAGVLRHTSLLIIEAYNFELTAGCLRFPQLCAHLESAGFRCYGLADPMRRPLDGVLWQMDLAFVPSTSPLFDSNRYE